MLRLVPPAPVGQGSRALGHRRASCPSLIAHEWHQFRTALQNSSPPLSAENWRSTRDCGGGVVRCERKSSNPFEIAEWPVAIRERADKLATLRPGSSASPSCPAARDAVKWTQPSSACTSSHAAPSRATALRARLPVTRRCSSPSPAHTSPSPLNPPTAPAPRFPLCPLVSRTLDKERSTTYLVLLEMSHLALPRIMFSPGTAPVNHRLPRASRPAHLSLLRLDLDAATRSTSR